MRNNYPLNKLYKISPKINEFLISRRSSRREETVLSRLHIGHSYMTHSFMYDSCWKENILLLYSMQWVAFFRTHVVALPFNWGPRKIFSCKFFWESCSWVFLWTPCLISSKRSMFFTSCSGLKFDNIYTVIYIFTLWFCWNLVVSLFFIHLFIWYWYNLFGPDMTYKLAWALKAKTGKLTYSSFALIVV